MGDIQNISLNFEVSGNASEQISQLDGQLENLETQTQKAFKGLEKIGAGVGTNAFDKIDDSVKKLGSDGETAFKKIDKSTKKAHNSSKGYNKGLKGLLGTAKRFLVFGAFFTIQRQVSQAFKDGSNNLYQYSKTIDGVFAQSMDRLASSFLYLKNAIGAAVAPIINVLTPVIEMLIDKVAALANSIGELFAALTGKNTFKKAIKYQKEYAEAVKATNNALAKFDEINNITTAAKQEDDPSKMFEIAEVGKTGWVADIKKAIEGGNWNEVGAIFARKINGIHEKFKEKDFGTKLGEKINKGLEIANGFIENFDFAGSADAILQTLTNLIDTIDFSKVGSALSKAIVGSFDIADRVSKWIGNKETPRKIVKAITDLIKGINWGKVIEKAITALMNAISAGVNFLSSLFGDPKILGMILTTVLKIIAGIFIGIWNSISNQIKEKGFGGFLKDFMRMLAPISSTIIAAVGKLAIGLWEIVKKVFAAGAKWIYSKLFEPVINAFSKLLEPVINAFIKIWENIIKPIWEPVADWFSEKIIEPVKKLWQDCCDAIGGFFSKLWGGIKKGFALAINGIIVSIENVINFSIRGLNGFLRGIGSIVGWIGDKIGKDWGDNIGNLNEVSFKRIETYQFGGYPKSGEMFIARENGIPEMVGSIGGRTAVANNNQIVEAVSIGVYNAVVDAMSRSGGNKQPTIVQINGREVFRAVQDESTSFRKRTGQPAF